jgi:hypothetical protein
MIAGLIVPSGNLSALTPQQVTVKPIAAVNVAVGDIVKFDIQCATATYTNSANLVNYDEPTCGFNVVVMSGAAATGEDGGVWGVVIEAAAQGRVCTVCIAGVVDAKVTTAGSTAAGQVLSPIAANVLGAPASAGNPAVAVLLEAANTTTAAIRKVLFNGFQIGSTAA